MSGQSKYRSLWERYYSDCHGVIFVIDSSDTMRMAVASNELLLMIQHPEMVKNRSTTTPTTGVPILILANKSDLQVAIPIGQVKKKRSWRRTFWNFLLLLFFLLRHTKEKEDPLFTRLREIVEDGWLSHVIRFPYHHPHRIFQTIQKHLGKYPPCCFREAKEKRWETTPPFSLCVCVPGGSISTESFWLRGGNRPLGGIARRLVYPPSAVVFQSKKEKGYVWWNDPPPRPSGWRDVTNGNGIKYVIVNCFFFQKI